MALNHFSNPMHLTLSKTSDPIKISFLSLPAEIRSKVYKLLLGRPNTLWSICNFGKRETWSGEHNIVDMSILQACKQPPTDANSLFLSNNNFPIDAFSLCADGEDDGPISTIPTRMHNLV